MEMGGLRGRRHKRPFALTREGRGVRKLKGEGRMENTVTRAWVHLCRLSGTNYSQPITRRGASIFVPDPQIPGKTYRVSAAKFDAGQGQVRENWYIEPWTERAARIVDAERDWQD